VTTPKTHSCEIFLRKMQEKKEILRNPARNGFLDPKNKFLKTGMCNLAVIKFLSKSVHIRRLCRRISARQFCRFCRRIPVQVSAYSPPPPSNSCKTILPLLLSTSCPSQCLYAASVVKFLQAKSVHICRLRRRIPANQANAPQRVSVARGFHSLPKS